jgi:hypothetical protein
MWLHSAVASSAVDLCEARSSIVSRGPASAEVRRATGWPQVGAAEVLRCLRACSDGRVVAARQAQRASPVSGRDSSRD